MVIRGEKEEEGRIREKKRETKSWSDFEMNFIDKKLTKACLTQITGKMR